jgi:Holliday junction resolvase RusA-like endonuclease
MIELTIPGRPLGKQRHRSRVINLKSGGSFLHEYTPEQTVNYELYVKILFTEKYPDFKPFAPKVPLHCDFKMYIPYTNDARKNNWVWAPNKPDEDNSKKIVYDALNHIAYADDSQIVSSTFEKRFSEQPRVELKLRLRSEQDRLDLEGSLWWR